MPAYVVVNVRVNDPVRYTDYIRMAPATILAHGGRYIARGGRTEVLEGEWRPARMVILEFPSVDHAKEWWNCPEYAEPKALRQATADTELVILEGLDTPIG